MKYIFPVMIIVLNLLAAAVYAFMGDFKRFIYFLAAAILNAAVI